LIGGACAIFVCLLACVYCYYKCFSGSQVSSLGVIDQLDGIQPMEEICNGR